MAKRLGPVYAYVSGTDAAPTGVLFRYKVEESTDVKLSYDGEYEMASPDFTKKIHDTGTVGEFWKDAIDAIKTSEGI